MVIPELSQARCELVANIAHQLNEHFIMLNAAGKETLESLAEKLDTNTTTVANFLSGKSVLSIRELADFVWAMGLDISVKTHNA